MGGIGKTALSLTFLHHPSVTARFGDHRWFISCEGVFNAEGLKSALAKAFKLSEINLILALRRLASSVKSDFLLTLDNFEIPWEHRDNRGAVEELLLQLIDVPRLSLCAVLNVRQAFLGHGQSFLLCNLSITKHQWRHLRLFQMFWRMQLA